MKPRSNREHNVDTVHPQGLGYFTDTEIPEWRGRATCYIQIKGPFGQFGKRGHVSCDMNLEWSVLPTDSELPLAGSSSTCRKRAPVNCNKKFYLLHSLRLQDPKAAPLVEIVQTACLKSCLAEKTCQAVLENTVMYFLKQPSLQSYESPPIRTVAKLGNTPSLDLCS
jgi:hypothetical protein